VARRGAGRRVHLEHRLVEVGIERPPDGIERLDAHAAQVIAHPLRHEPHAVRPRGGHARGVGAVERAIEVVAERHDLEQRGVLRAAPRLLFVATRAAAVVLEVGFGPQPAVAERGGILAGGVGRLGRMPGRRRIGIAGGVGLRARILRLPPLRIASGVGRPGVTRDRRPLAGAHDLRIWATRVPTASTTPSASE
jgi:hypothetical protein